MKARSFKSFSALLGFSALTSIAVTAHATAGSTMNNAKINDLTVDEDTTSARINVGSVAQLTGTRPACQSSGWTTHYAFDDTTAKGKAMLATLTSALLAGKSVSITGAGVCTSIVRTSGLGSISLETVLAVTLFP